MEAAQIEHTNHVERRGSIVLQGAPEEVFPLFGPDREGEWAEGWEPEPVYPEVVKAQEGAVFRTTHGGGEAVWVVNQCDVERRVVEYTNFRHDNRVTRVRVSVEHAPERDGWSAAHVSYALTALSERGTQHLAHFTEAHYREMLVEWEQAVNACLSRRA